MKTTVDHVSEVLREKSHISEEREGELWEGLDKTAAQIQRGGNLRFLSGGPERA